MSNGIGNMHQTSKVLLLNKFSYVNKGKNEKTSLDEVKSAEPFNELIINLAQDYSIKENLS